jgi:ketosteroid isomerase-like protein
MGEIEISTSDRALAGSLSARIARLEAGNEIRLLAARYAAAIDERDFERLTSVFAADAVLRGSRVEARGHEEIRAAIVATVSNWTGPTVHFIGNHDIDLHDEERAEGTVYCRAEHERGEEWLIEMLRYRDAYERRAGRWLITERIAQPWYAVDLLERPTGPLKVRWGDRPPAPATLPDAWPSYAAFVASSSGSSSPSAPYRAVRRESDT